MFLVHVFHTHCNYIMITKTYNITLTEVQAKDLYDLLATVSYEVNHELSHGLDQLYLELKKALNE